MQSLQALAAALKQPSKPFAEWQPTHCGQLPIEIDQQGQWLYAGSKINREALIKLFASVLCKEGDEFFLKTPVEKIAITVTDAPFLIVSWRFEQTTQGQVLCCEDNLNRDWLVTRDQTLQVRQYQGMALPYLQLPHGLSARVARNVYYQWAEIAQQDQQGYFVESLGLRYYIA